MRSSPLLLCVLLLVSSLAHAQEIQLTQQVIAASPVEASAYSWTVMVDGKLQEQPSSDKKTIIVTLHGQQSVTLILSVVTDGKLQTYTIDANRPGPVPPPPPPPKPEGVASLVVVMESSDRTPPQQKLFVQLQTKYKQYPVLIIDKDSSQPNLKVAIEAARLKGIPGVVSLDDAGDVVGVIPLPADYAKFVEAFDE